MTLLAAFKTLLYRYTGQSDLLVVTAYSWSQPTLRVRSRLRRETLLQRCLTGSGTADWLLRQYAGAAD